MIYIYIWLVFSLIIGIIDCFHYKLWKYNLYKWLYESITYPVNVYRIKKKMKYMMESQKIKYYTDLLVSDKWFKNYWFWRKLERVILKQINIV